MGHIDSKKRAIGILSNRRFIDKNLSLEKPPFNTPFLNTFFHQDEWHLQAPVYEHLRAELGYLSFNDLLDHWRRSKHTDVSASQRGAAGGGAMEVVA